MDTEYSASIVAGMASTMILETREGGESLPDYKMRSIVAVLPDYPDEEQIELGEQLLRQYYLGYLDVHIDLSKIDGPVYRFNMNKPS